VGAVQVVAEMDGLDRLLSSVGQDVLWESLGAAGRVVPCAARGCLAGAACGRSPRRAWSARCGGTRPACCIPRRRCGEPGSGWWGLRSARSPPGCRVRDSVGTSPRAGPRLSCSKTRVSMAIWSRSSTSWPGSTRSWSGRSPRRSSTRPSRSSADTWRRTRAWWTPAAAPAASFAASPRWSPKARRSGWTCRGHGQGRARLRACERTGQLRVLPSGRLRSSAPVPRQVRRRLQLPGAPSLP
jgi:hypothetical protein